MEFIEYACENILDKDWSSDAVVGFAKRQTNWKDKPIVSTKTLYNYIDQSKLHVRNIDLPMKTKLNTKKKHIRKHRRVLGMSIAERPPEVDDRLEFGHWEIDTVEGEMSDDNALLTHVERKIRNYYLIKIDDQNDDSVDYVMNKLQNHFGKLFPYIFKTITSDNGSEFGNLVDCLKNVTEVYFARSYTSYERGSNHKNNRLFRHYIPKGKATSDYSKDAIKRIYQTLNNLPRKILNYKQPAVVFEEEIVKLV